MRRLPPVILAVLLLVAVPLHAAVHPAGSPSTTNNNDTCDIVLLPAATLLLPYFEVDLTQPSGSGATTLFTITNVSPQEQVAHVTLWTDYAYPVVGFNVYLTGYDVQSINLYDVLTGFLAPPRGTGTTVSPEGELSTGNPALDREFCDRLPDRMPAAIVPRVQSAFTTGRVPALGGLPECTRVGGPHRSATGYATIDVVKACNTILPTQTAYYDGVIAFDNVLAGDYYHVHGAEGAARGEPLVHIRATPNEPVNFRDTFYGRFQSAAAPKRDRRQPLPSLFVPHWVDDGVIETHVTMWREGLTGADASCDRYKDNATISAIEVVTFDEEENAVAVGSEGCPFPPCPDLTVRTPAVLRAAYDSDYFEKLPGARAGWLYLNFSDEESAAPRQAWVLTSTRIAGRYSSERHAAALGNGCSGRTALSEVHPAGIAVIGPAPNVTP